MWISPASAEIISNVIAPEILGKVLDGLDHLFAILKNAWYNVI